MIIAERTEKLNSIDYESFGEEMQDGRLTEPSDGKKYRLREPNLYSKRLGRPLTD